MLSSAYYPDRQRLGVGFGGRCARNAALGRCLLVAARRVTLLGSFASDCLEEGSLRPPGSRMVNAHFNPAVIVNVRLALPNALRFCCRGVRRSRASQSRT